ncbi:unnamed protein product [Closterium sp. NIES-54]
MRRKGDVTEVLIDWIRGARRQLSESFGSDLPVLRLHSDRGGEFSSDLLRAFCRAEGIRQTFTLPASPQQNGIVERRIGMVMDVARTSMIHAAAPHFLWPFVVQYAAHQINLQPCFSLPETTPTLRWTGKVGDASVFCVWGSPAFVRDTSADKLSSRAVPYVFLGFPPTHLGGSFTTPPRVVFCPLRTSRLRSRSPTTVSFPTALPLSPPSPLFLAPGAPPVDPVKPVEVAVDSGAARGAEPVGAGPGGAVRGVAESEGAEPGGAESEGAEPGGAELERVEPGDAEPGGVEPWGAESGGPPGVPLWREPLSPQRLREWYARRCSHAVGATGPAAGGASGAGAAESAAGARSAGAAGLGGAGTGGSGAVGGPAGVGAAGGAGAAGPRGARTRGTGAAGAGDAAGVGAVGAGAVATGGAAGDGAVGGTGAGGTTGVVAGDPGAEGTGAVFAISGGATQPRLYYVPLLQQVLGLPPSTGPTPPLLSPPPVQSQSQLQPASPLPGPSPYSGPTRGLTERREPESRPASPESRPESPVRAVRTGRRVPGQRPPPVPGTHSMTLRPSTAPQRVPLLSPPASSLPDSSDPESDSLRTASPTVTRFLATAVTDPLFESTATSALVAELVDFAAACRLDYATSLFVESESASVCPPFVGGECALGTDVLEDRQEEFECFAAALPHLVSMLLAPEGDPDALDIPTPRSYAEAIEGPYSSQWQAAMDTEMASWKSSGTYVDEVPSPGANIVSGMWIFRVKRLPGSRRVTLHVASVSDRDLHEEIWLRRPPVFTGSFLAGTQWSLRRPVYGLRQAPREWHDTLRTTLAALGFAPSTADPSLFLRTDTTLPPLYVLVYVDDLVFATADIEALAHVKSELQKKHTCTDSGFPTSAGQQSRRAAQQPSRPAAEPPEPPSSRAARAAEPPCSWAATAPADEPRLYLLRLCDRADGLSLFDLTSGASPAPPATADSTVRSQWATRDAAAHLAVRRHLPTTERAHLSQYRSAQTLYDAIVARYSSPATAALSRLMLPYLFPDLAAFPTVADLITHLRTSDTRYRAALLAEDHFLSVCPTTLTVDLLEQRLLAAETSIVTVGASRGDPRTPVFEGCSPSSLLPSVASAAAADLGGFEAMVGLAGVVEVVVEAVEGVGVVVGVVVGVEVSAAAVEAEEAVAVAEGAEVVEAAGVAEAAEAAVELVAALRRGVAPVAVSASSSSVVVRPRPPQQLREWYAGHQRGGGTGPCTYVHRTGDRAGEQCGGLHSTQRCFGRLTDAWRHQFLDATEIPRWGDLSRAGVAIFDLHYDVILATMYAVSTSDEGDCYLCLPPDLSGEAAALGACEAAALGAGASAAPGTGESALSGTTSAQVFHTFTLDSGASRSFFRDRTTLTPLSRPVAVSLADPSGGPVLASFSTVLPCPVAPSGTLSGLYLPSFSTNLVSGADLQDQGVDQFTPASQRVTHCTCARTGRHLATFTRRPGSSLYTLSTESPSVPASGQRAASSQVFAAASGSGPESAPCSCRLLSHQTLLWHHRLGHPSLPRLRGMASRVLVSGLPRSLPPLPLGPAPTCVPCVEGRQRAAPHSSEFPPTEAPLQTLHMDVWGPARVRGQGHERYFLLVVDDYSRYTTVFPLRSKGDIAEVLIDWIRAARLQLRESFGSDFPVLRLHSDRGGEFSSARLGAFCRAQGIRQTFTLLASPQQNGIAERRIGMVMDVARTSMIYVAAPHFLWPFAVQYAAHQLNLQPWVSLPETSPTLRWTGKVGDASAFRVWGSRAFVRDLSADKQSPRAVPCVFLGFPPDAPGWQFYHPTSRRVLSSQDVTFDESGPAPSGVSQVDAVEPVNVAVDSGAARGAEPVGAGSGGAEPGGAESGGAESGGAEPEGAEPGGAEPGGAEPGGAEPGGADRAAGPGGPPVAPGPGGASTGGTGAAAATGVGPAGASGATGAGATGGVGAGFGAAGASGAAGAGATGGVGAGVGRAGGTAGSTGGTGAAGPAGVGAIGAGGAAGIGAATGGPGAVPVCTGDPARPRPYFVPLLEQVLGLPPSSGPAPPLECPQPVQSQSQLQPVSPLPAPSPYAGPTGGLAERREPASHPASPVRTTRTSRRAPRPRLPAVPGTHQMTLRPSTAPLRVPLPSPPESSLPVLAYPASDSLRAASPSVARLLSTVVTDPSFESTAASALSASVCPPSVGGECALSTDVLEDRQEEFQCFAAALPHLVSTLLAPEGEPDAPDIPTPRLYAEAIEGPYSSQWQSAMDAEMASWKSTGTYVDEVPPPGANIVSGMWIFRVKRPPGSPPVFKARYVARGFSQRQGVDYFQTFSPTPKMTTLRVLLHVAAQRDYKLHSLNFSTAFLQGSLLLCSDCVVFLLALQRFGFTYSSPLSTPLPTGHSLSAPPSDESVEPSGPYPELVGCLVYLMNCTRPDLAYPLSLLAHYVAPGRHRKVHWDAAKRVLRYLCSTLGMGLVLGGRARVVLTGHADASWVDDLATQRSSQGYTFSLCSGSVSWRSTRSSSVLSSSCEAEIYAGAMAAQELRWLTDLLTDLGEAPHSPPVLYPMEPPAASLRSPQAPHEWHDTLRTTLAALGFAPSTADPSLFLRTDTSLPPFYVLVYVDDLVFATADTEALTLVKSELQKRHTSTDLGELHSYLGLQITQDRALHTITLTQSHMVHQVLQRFGFQFSSPQPTPLSTAHSLSAPPSDETVELSGSYPELVGCLMYLMTCTRPDLAYPLSLLARYVAPSRHRKVH